MKVVKEKIEALKQRLSNRDGLKAADVREGINELQQKSLKLFEAAYRKMAEKNQQGSGGGSSSGSNSQEQEEPQKKEGQQ